MYSFSTKGIRSKKIKIEANGSKIKLLVLKPISEPVNAPGVMWIHGGGYMTGMKEMAYIGRAADLVRNHGAVVIAPGYHLSLFHPYPTALNDCYATLLYIKDHAKELGNDYFYMIGESWCKRNDAVARHSKDKSDSIAREQACRIHSPQWP